MISPITDALLRAQLTLKGLEPYLPEGFDPHRDSPFSQEFRSTDMSKLIEFLGHLTGIIIRQQRRIEELQQENNQLRADIDLSRAELQKFQDEVDQIIADTFAKSPDLTLPAQTLVIRETDSSEAVIPASASRHLTRMAMT